MTDVSVEGVFSRMRRWPGKDPFSIPSVVGWSQPLFKALN